MNPDRLSSRRWLIAIAAPKELESAIRAFGFEGDAPEPWQCVSMSQRIDLVLTGVGKPNAAGAIGRVLDPQCHLGVLSIGIGGAYGDRCRLGEVIGASVSVFGDEGVLTPDGFEPCAAMGFGLFGDGTDSIAHDSQVIELIRPLCDQIGPIACVSACSGTDQSADAIATRTGAIAESMEGAAVALAARRVDPAMLTGEVRVISNTAGDRANQQWDLDGALEKLCDVLGRIAQVLK